MAIQKIFLGTTTGDKTGDGAKLAGDKINKNFEYLEGKIESVDQLVAETGFVLVNQDLTMTTGWQWLINGIEYTNPQDVVINIPFASSGNQRIDLIVMNSSNTFARIGGVESASNPVAPLVPNDTVQATIILVTDAAINEPAAPITGDSYIAKRELSSKKLYGTGNKAEFSINDDVATFRIMEAASIGSVAVAANNKKYLYSGKDHFVRNETGGDLIIKHNSGTGNFKYFFASEIDLTIKKNEIVHFKFRFSNGNNGFLDYVGAVPVGVNISQDIETDKGSTTKVPSAKETFDWGVSKFQPKLNNIVIDPGISRTFAVDDLGKTIIFTGTNPVALTLPTNVAVPLAIGFRVKVTQQGTGVVTSSTAGISTITDSGNVSVQGETREYIKTDIDTWSVEGNPIAIGKLKEIVVQNKTQLLGVLRSDSLYLIDGSFDFLAGETIVVPAGGLNITGYTFDASRLSSYGVTNHKIFTSPVGGSGNLIIHNIAFTTTGTGAGVFDIIDSDGTHALEMVTVNFEGCKQIGKIKNYRQGTGITIGIYGCADGLQLSGTWTGFKLTNTNCFSFGTTGTMFKKDTDTIFSNRLYLEINVDLPTGAKLADFQPSNFSLPELFQMNSSLIKYNGTINDTNTTAILPNITANDSKSLWRSNVGIPDTAKEKIRENLAVTGTFVINWLVDTYNLVLTGNTTFTDSNLPATLKNTHELQIYVNPGAFTLTFPTAWNTNKVGTLKPNEMNKLTLKFIKTGVYFLKIDNSLSVYPAPNLSSVFPTRVYPSSTSAVTLYGSFFTPATIVSISGGHTVAQVVFINQGELQLSVVTTASEGDFSITISNGTSVTYANKLSVFIGTVYVPNNSDYTVISGNVDTSVNGEVKVVTDNVQGIVEFFNIPFGQNFRVNQNARRSLINTVAGVGLGTTRVCLYQNGARLFSLESYMNDARTDNVFYYINQKSTGFGYGASRGSVSNIYSNTVTFERIGTTFYIKSAGVIVHTFSDSLASGNLQIRVQTKHIDVVNIKYIELA
jgi:hypothetical protein